MISPFFQCLFCLQSFSVYSRFTTHMCTCRELISNPITCIYCWEICILQEKTSWGNQLNPITETSFLILIGVLESVDCDLESVKMHWMWIFTRYTLYNSTAVRNWGSETASGLCRYYILNLKVSAFDSFPLSEYEKALSSHQLDRTVCLSWRTWYKARWQCSLVNKMVACKRFPSALKCTLYS